MAQPGYEVVLDNGIDIAIERTDGHNRKSLCVFLPSQNQYYIKKDDLEPFAPNTDELATFFSRLGEKKNDIPNALKTHAAWLPVIIKGKEFWDTCTSIMTREGFQEAAKQGSVDIYADYIKRNHRSLWVDTYGNAIIAAPFIKSFLKNEGKGVFKAAQKVTELWLAIRPILNAFGLDCGRKWAKALIDLEDRNYWSYPIWQDADRLEEILYMNIEQAKARGAKRWDYASGAKRWDYASNHAYRGQADPTDFHTTFDFDAFCAYVIDKLENEYFKTDFLEEWKDTLKLEITCYGKVVDKYPKNLKSAHFTLSALARRMAVEVDPVRAKAAFDEHKPLEWERKTKGVAYAFIAPTNTQDLRDEAIGQANCLASYVTTVAHGETQIMFLRKSDAIDTSYVTIEVDPVTNAIVQALGRFNTEPDAPAWNVIALWAKKKNLDTRKVQERMDAAIETLKGEGKTK